MIIVKDNTPKGIRALVIGAGRYPKAQPYDLYDLGSATLSALAFAQWLKEHLRYPNLKLKYLNLVVSKANLSNNVNHVNRETKQNYEGELINYKRYFSQVNSSWDFESTNLELIKSAVKEWKNQCNLSKDEVGFFYFCGHGIEFEGKMGLIAENFDGQNDDISGGSFDLRALHSASSKFKASNKYFFIDSCRTTPNKLIGTDPDKFSPSVILLTPNKKYKKYSNFQGDAPLYLSTQENEPSFGDHDKVSQFTNALIISLNGAGAEQAGSNSLYKNRWIITSQTLLKGIQEVLEFMHKYVPHNSELQRPDTGDSPVTGTILHIPETEVKIPIRLNWPKTWTEFYLHFHQSRPPIYEWKETSKYQQAPLIDSGKAIPDPIVLVSFSQHNQPDKAIEMGNWDYLCPPVYEKDLCNNQR
ncbi:MAG: caspase family protein [Crocosphaera sp.]